MKLWNHDDAGCFAVLLRLAALACLAGCGTYYSETPNQYGVAKRFATFQDYGYNYADENIRKGGIDGVRTSGGNAVEVGRITSATAVPGAGFSVGGANGLVVTGPSSTSAPTREVTTGIGTWARIKGIFGLGELITEETGDTLRAGIDAASN